MGLKAPLFAPLISAGAAVSVLFALITRCILRLEKQMKGSLNSNQVLYRPLLTIFLCGIVLRIQNESYDRTV